MSIEITRRSVVQRHWEALLLALVFISGPGLVGCSTVPRSFSPEQPIAAKDFSHEAFAIALRVHVREGWIDYGGIAGDRLFSDYLRQLDGVDPNSLFSREHRLAFWINAYNAFAIKGILDGYSPMTLFGRYRYFIARGYQVGGETINLYDLEQKVLIPDFREPRIHFAIVCASRSCPKLQSWVYSTDKLDQQLEESAKGFVNDPTRNQFDRQQKLARLSMIFHWFREDFEAHSGSLLNYVKRYVADPDLARDLEAIPYKVEFLEYDWRLNGPPPGQISEYARPS